MWILALAILVTCSGGGVRDSCQPNVEIDTASRSVDGITLFFTNVPCTDPVLQFRYGGNPGNERPTVRKLRPGLHVPRGYESVYHTL
ncbi:hypothetical protein CPB85DRAFT_880675 [Mucidula mucida]|nr:hypothetical protein CPB85DRAFT_880675 [Mucidula mucida]